jgi:hypothetical protein
LVFGAFGVLAYLAHLVMKFYSAPWFPIAAGVVGVALIVAAFKWETIKNWLKSNF